MIEGFTANRQVILAKSRQMMATWTVLSWILYKVLHDEPGVYLLLSKGQRDSVELTKRLKIIIEHLPDQIKEGIKIANTELTFPSGSRMKSLPASEHAARMYSPAGVFWDEMAFTPNSEEIWSAVKPALNSGGFFVGISTPNGMDNAFYEIYKNEDNGFHKLRVHWKDNPLNNQKWESEARRGLSEDRWKQEYEIDFGVLKDQVFNEFSDEIHIVQEEFRFKRGSGKLYRSMDFGYHHPYVIWMHISQFGEMTVFDEWEGKDCVLHTLAEAIWAIDRKHGLNEDDFSWSACDPSGASITDKGISSVERLRQYGFKIYYRSSEIMTGVEMIKSRLRDATGVVSLRFTGNVVRTIHHLKHYRWKRGLDRPDKDNVHDHAVDALRYLLVNLASYVPEAVLLPRVSGSWA